MAEQDRYGGWFGGNKADKVQEKAQQAVPKASGAEQDRYGGWFGGDKADRVKGAMPQNLPKGSGAEQDHYERSFGGDRLPSAGQASESLPQVSGAEQDRYGRWFGGDKFTDIERRLPRTSGAEQDRYEHWFGGHKLPTRLDIEKRLPKTSGAEQDRYERWFGRHDGPSATQLKESLPTGSGAEQDRYGSHFTSNRPANVRFVGTTSTLGLLQHAILPSFGFHSGLSVIAYGVGRYTDTVEAKDWLWPAGQVANAWWSAIGAPVVYEGLSFSEAWDALSYNQKLLLVGVSAWGIRLFYRIASRTLRRGKDDPRYETSARKQPDFWNKAFFTMFLPEALIQTLISLPFTLPFRAPIASALAAPFPEATTISHSLAIFLFTAGYSLETVADSHLEAHNRTASAELNREGVWSIVRHPNYLGDALCHLSFPLLLYSAGQLHPLTIVGPIANYIFLRFISGDKANEENQEKRYSKENPVKYQELQQYKQSKNSFWPGLAEVSNKWLWAIAAAGAGGVVVERSLNGLLRS
ncbi:DUF1295-domain-containing protein [Annulohypoxylon truncatum]|uniref:DUF1295-domain-containing protein n=1 Tax=Annulohypoxylon truncatum TaxID=327061 RepID=UPI00200894B5|nr:DUF1295-domain-containing protein [Annulohypoxylon truncatum]KAI1205267.1 DUF1295-domain-containing protein [Annulohypoxylon truncatum]